jgi:hypothetical protein
MKDYRKDPRFRESFSLPTESQMFLDGTDIGQFINALLEVGPIKKPQNTPMPIDDPKRAVEQMTLQPTAPETAPEPPQAQGTPQPPPTSKTAPEPSQAPTKDPVVALGGETVKKAPPEIFT